SSPSGGTRRGESLERVSRSALGAAPPRAPPWTEGARNAEKSGKRTRVFRPKLRKATRGSDPIARRRKNDATKTSIRRNGRMQVPKNMQLDDLQSHAGEWLGGSGPQSDIVISSRVRLARNLAGFPFLSRANARETSDVEREIRERLVTLKPELAYFSLPN